MMSSVLSELFQTVLSLSLVGSYVIILVLLVRLVLCKAPKWCSYVLWGVVFLRLMCPVFPEAQFSLIPNELDSVRLTEWMKTEETDNTLSGAAEGMDYTATSEARLNKVEALQDNRQPQSQSDLELAKRQQQVQDLPEPSANTQTLYIISLLWLFGALLLAGYHTCSYWYLKRKVKDAVVVEPGVKEIPGEHLSFVMGVFKPIIYLSESLDEESRRVVLCHEQVHLRRRDYLTKPIALAICCVHWFNPLVWLAFYLMNKDCEMSCDEKVVSLLGEQSKKIYSYALLDEATKGERKYYQKKTVCALLSFGEDNVKNRISHVLHYKKASLWIIACVVIVLIGLIVGLCCNPGKESLTVEAAWKIIRTEGGYAEGVASQWFVVDYENDGKKEIFAEIGEKQADTEQLAGDLWFVSEDGEATLLLEDKSFYRWEPFVSRKKEFPLFSYWEGEDLQTIVYGVQDGKAKLMLNESGEKYVAGDVIVCNYPDMRLEYDIKNLTFTGYNEKPYICYYDGRNFIFYTGHKLTKEEVEAYNNGKEILDGLEQAYPEAQFEYMGRENGWLHVNMAYREQDTVKFRYVTYDDRKGTLTLLDEGLGCYGNPGQMGGITFVEKIAAEYDWQADSAMVAAQMTPESALDRFALAFTDRDGNTLYQLSHDKENFENWDMVIPLANGTYTFGNSSPWPEAGDYRVEYTEGADEATIRFIMSNSAPEKYVAIEKVKLVKGAALYYVDHVAFHMYDKLETRAELAEIFDLNAAVPFDSVSSGYDASFPRIIHWHFLNETNSEYYSIYNDAISAAKAMLHLGAGTGEVTEVLHGVLPQQKLSSSYGEGSVVNVRYTFAKDGSVVDIPMVLADESENIWVLYNGD